MEEICRKAKEVKEEGIEYRYVPMYVYMYYVYYFIVNMEQRPGCVADSEIIQSVPCHACHK